MNLEAVIKTNLNHVANLVASEKPKGSGPIMSPKVLPLHLEDIAGHKA